MRLALLMVLPLLALCAPGVSAPAIPAVPREVRATWCATVSNIDWPTGTGQSVSTQQTKLRQHMDALVSANMNCMYLQIRPACDAFYSSSIEPWSQWLTGTQGNNPGYDPLTFAITEAQKRGLELHGWVNPYRAAIDLSTTNKASNHVTKTHPEWIVAYSDNRRYLNMGLPAVRTYIRSVITDMVTRYDLDGIVFDDYFYPGPSFADSAAYSTYTAGGGALSLDNWRRDNVNKLISEVSQDVHAARLGCQFEVGPFGIWQPGYPAGITGANYYTTHYCDSRKWLQEGTVDSLSPQIYWSLASTGQPFGKLIDWWVAQNTGRHALASTACYKLISDPTNFPSGTEIVNQVYRVRTAGGKGTVHYSMKHITGDQSGVTTGLKNGPYVEQALKPATPWLDSAPPAAPNVTVGALTGSPATRNISWTNSGAESVRWWCFHTWNGTAWKLKILPGITTSTTVDNTILELAVTAVDKSGNEGARTPKVVNNTVDQWPEY